LRGAIEAADRQARDGRVKAALVLLVALKWMPAADRRRS
jgi:hypothetical protein